MLLLNAYFKHSTIEMGEYIINNNTSLLALNTKNLKGGSTIVVYVSTTSELGQFVTIRDIDGFISTPQSILISTVGCTITDGSISLKQRFGYVTLQSVSTNIWTVINNSAFLEPSSNYGIRGLEAYDITSQSNVSIRNYVSTTQAIDGKSATFQSTFSSSAPVFTGKLQINTLLDTFNSVIDGNFNNTRDYFVNGTLSTAGNVSLFSTLINTGISTSVSFNVQGGIIQSTVAGRLTIQGFISSGFELFALNQMSTGGLLQISTSAAINQNLSVPTLNFNLTNSVNVNTNNIFLSSTSIVARSDITVVDSTYTGLTTPVVFINSGSAATTTVADWVTTDSINTGSLNVIDSISSSLSSIIFGSASIINPRGSLQISSINTDSLRISSIFGAGGSSNLLEIKTNTVTTSTLNLQYECITPFLQIQNANVSTLRSGFITTSSLNLGNTELKSESITLSSIFISSGVNLTTLSSIQMPGTLFNNGGSIQTGSVHSITTNTSTIYVNEINSGNLPMLFSTPTVFFSNANISSLQFTGGTIDSLKGTGIQFGPPLSFSTLTPGGLYLIPSTVSGITSNTPYEYISGLGTVYSPILGKASNNKSVFMTLGNISSFSTSYINVSMNYRNDGSTNGVAGFRIRNKNSFSTLISFNANPVQPLQTVTLSNYSVERDFSPIGTSYYLTGPVTEPLSYEGNIVIGVGQGNAIQYSSDYGVTWMAPNSPFSKASGIAWSGEKWVAAGQGTTSIAYSYTGLIWYAAESPFTEGRAVVWNGSIWIAGGSGTNTLAYSYDGIVWTGNNVIFTGQVNGIAWNGFMFIAVGAGTNTIAYSYDGIVWTGLGTVFTVSGNGVAWGNKWVAVGVGGSTSAYSLDGFVWIGETTIGTGLSVGWNGSQWLIGGGTPSLAYSSDGIAWTPVTAPMSTVNAIIWALNRWVITGSSGGFSTSADGITWYSGSTRFSTSGYGVASRQPLYTEPLLYTTGDNFTLSYSLGGSTWYTVSSLIMGIANAIRWNGTLWLAAMASGSDTFIYSYDGVTWIGLGQIGFNSSSSGIAWNGFVWVATCTGPNTIMYSYDGITWTGLGIFTQGGGVAYGNGLFVATGGSAFASSLDGVTWTTTASIFTSGGKVAYGNGRWIACGTGTTTLAYTDNGTTWTAISSPFSIAANDIAYNGYQWLAVGADSTGANVAYSSDGLTWTKITVANISAQGVVWGGAWFVTGTAARVYKSLDAINWTAATSETGPAYTIATKQSYGAIDKTQTIVCGEFSASSDGTHWFPIVSPLTTSCVASNGRIWVAGGSGAYQIAYSTNGIQWTGVTIADMTAVKSVAWQGKWIAVGEGLYNRAESLDGITWTPIGNSIGGFFSGTAYGIIGGVGWIAAGTGGLLYSDDGTTWTVLSNLLTTAYGIATNGKQFIAVGSGTNTVAYSYNGTAWIGLGAVLSRGTAVAYGNNSWVAVGQGTNTIAVSTDGIIWTGLGTTIFSEGTGVFWNGQQFIATGLGPNTIATSADGFTWVGLGTTIAATGVGGYLIPLKRYSSREAHIYTLQCSGAAAVSQTVAQKFGTVPAWDAAVYTLESYTANAYMSFTPTSLTGWSMVGFSENPSIDTTPSSLNYSISCNAGTVSIYQLGFLVQTFSTFSLGDSFTIIFTGSAVQYYWNTTLLRSVARPVGAPLHMSCLLYSPGLVIKDLDFHAVYQLTTVAPALSTTSFVATTTPGLITKYSPPFYLTLTSDLTPSLWTLNVTAGGTISTASLYADVYINTTKYFSTNVLTNISLTNVSTYSLNFSVSTAIIRNSGDTLNFHFKGARGDGDAYIFTNWVNSNAVQASSIITRSEDNPNAAEFLEYFHTNTTGLQTSEISVFLSPTSTNMVSYIDSNYGLVMNKSYIKWNNALNGITIQNRYNDIQTRSLTYTGALYNASDSNLKHSIEYIDSSLYMTAIKDLPLRRFEFNDSYRETFGTKDCRQLGVLTSEVEPIFPKIIQEVEFEHCGLSTIKTVDRTQLRYAHLAATQELIKRISVLKGVILKSCT